MTAMNPIHFDPALPISRKSDEIARAVAAHPVVIVCGETDLGVCVVLPELVGTRVSPMS